MRSYFLLALFLFGSVVTVLSQHECTSPNTWVSMPSMPKTTGEVSSVIINDELYVAGEQNTDTFKYSFADGTWTTAAKRIYAGNHQSAWVINNEWWLVGGIDANSYGRVQVYNVDNNKWREYASMPWDGGSVCTAYIGGVIYACGGIYGFNGGQRGGGNGTTDECAYYNVTRGDNKWVKEEHMPIGRNHAASTVGPQGKFWIFGGRMGTNVPQNGFNNTQVYDPHSKTWQTTASDGLAPLPIGRGGTGHSIYNNGMFYVFGGETHNGPGATSNYVYNRTDIYDMQKNEWKSGTVMPHPRHGIFPVLYKNAIYIAAGGPHNGYAHSDIFDKYCL